MTDTNKNSDPLSKGLGMAIALGALAVGAAAAFLNSERTRQMREDLQRQISDLSDRMDRELTARRPEIEDAIQRGRQVAVESLERVKGAVEQGADRAQEYVQRASVKTSDAAVDLRDKTSTATSEAAGKAEDTVDSITPRAHDSLAAVASGEITGMSNSDSQPGFSEQNTALGQPAGESGYGSTDAPEDTNMAGTIIGAANVEAAQSLDDAEYNRTTGSMGGENAPDEAPGMADYRADTSFGADLSVDRPGEDNKSQ